VLVGIGGNILFANSIGLPLTFTPSSLTTTLAAGTAVTLQASNDITVDSAITVNGTTGGALTMQAGRNINLNSILTTANGNFTAIAGDPGAIAADRLAGTPAVTLGTGASINAGTGTVTLGAIGGNFINNSGSATPITASRWLTYSTNPAADILGGMAAGNKHYAQAYTGTTPAYATAGNWNLYSVAPVLSVTPGSQTVTYGTAPANFTPGYTGFIDGDTSTTSGISDTAGFSVGGTTSTSGNFTAGSHNVAYSIGLASGLGYTFADDTATLNELTVNALNLTIAGLTANNKVYNANTTAILGGNAAVTALGSDIVTVGGIASGPFADKNVGTGKAVTVSGNTISGIDAANYNLVQQTGLSADITKANLSVSGLTANNKVYNADNVATLGGAAAVSAIGTDVVTVGGIASGLFADKNAGTGKAVTVTGNTITGTDSANYNLVQQTGLSADITAQPIPEPPDNKNLDNNLIDAIRSSLLVAPPGTNGSFVQNGTNSTLITVSKPLDAGIGSPTVIARKNQELITMDSQGLDK
jgi:YDG domain